MQNSQKLQNSQKFQSSLRSQKRLRFKIEKKKKIKIHNFFSVHLGQNSEQRHAMVPYIYVRDEIHARMPALSKNKTSRACQRRINYMCKNPRTIKDVSLFLTEVKSDREIQQRFPIPERGELGRDENDHRLKADFPPLLDVLERKFKDKFGSADDLDAEDLIPNR